MKITAIKAGQVLLFTYGQGEYRDGRGKAYPLQYCLMYDKDASTLVACPDRYRPK